METLAVYKDYAGTEVRTRHWMNMEQTMYMLSVVQGPAAASATATVWSQYEEGNDISMHVMWTVECTAGDQRCCM